MYIAHIPSGIFLRVGGFPYAFFWDEIDSISFCAFVFLTLCCTNHFLIDLNLYAVSAVQTMAR